MRTRWTKAPSLQSELYTDCSRALKLNTCLSQMGFQSTDWSSNASHVRNSAFTNIITPHVVSRQIIAPQICNQKHHSSAFLF